MWKDLNHFVIEVIAFGSFAVSIGSLLIEPGDAASTALRKAYFRDSF